jgi:hypothetical protein
MVKLRKGKSRVERFVVQPFNGRGAPWWCPAVETRPPDSCNEGRSLRQRAPTPMNTVIARTTADLSLARRNPPRARPCADAPGRPRQPDMKATP